MARLRNRQQNTPVGWRFKQPQISPNDITADSFKNLTRAVIRLRKANEGISKQYALSTDLPVVENEVDAFVAALCVAGGYTGFIQQEGGEHEFPKPWTPQRLRQNVEAAVGVVKKVMVGAGIYVDWLGSGGVPVSREKSESRANVCVEKCSDFNGHNKLRGNFTDYFTETASEAIMKMIAIKNDMNLSTSVDDQLHVCDLCLCPLKAKVWTPISHVKTKLNQKTLDSLPEHCWIKLESK